LEKKKLIDQLIVSLLEAKDDLPHFCLGEIVNIGNAHTVTNGTHPCKRIEHIYNHFAT
jgi:hypothetical protein